MEDVLMEPLESIPSAKLFSYTQLAQSFSSPFEERTDLGRIIAFCARVSNPANQNNVETVDRLINYLIRNKHWSPFEMVNVSLEIVTTRDIARQMLRHGLRFQEFCVAGSTQIFFDEPGQLMRNRRAIYKRTIAQLYESQQAGKPLPSKLRVFDENTQTFTNTTVRRVFQTGIKPTFKITLANGKEIVCTKEHKFLTKEGFVPLEDAIGLRLVGKTAVMTRPETMLACNGVCAYRDKAWLSQAKEKAMEDKTGLGGIAALAGTSIHTIRKWLKFFNLQFTKKEVASYTPIWNKGVSGYNLPRHSEATIKKMREKARKGSDSNLWRGGADRTTFAHAKVWGQRRQGSSTLTVSWSRVEKVEYVGEQMTYDLEVEHPSHNYIANGIVVHNSQRYANPLESFNFHLREPRYQDTKNRQNSIEFGNSYDEAVLEDAWYNKIIGLISHAEMIYNWAIEKGIAKEVARAVLPEGLTVSRLYANGSIRQWIHYIEVRTDPTTQKEHRELAAACAMEIAKVFPSINNFLPLETPDAHAK